MQHGPSKKAMLLWVKITATGLITEDFKALPRAILINTPVLGPGPRVGLARVGVVSCIVGALRSTGQYAVCSKSLKPQGWMDAEVLCGYYSAANRVSPEASGTGRARSHRQAVPPSSVAQAKAIERLRGVRKRCEL